MAKQIIPNNACSSNFKLEWANQALCDDLLMLCNSWKHIWPRLMKTHTQWAPIVGREGLSDAPLVSPGWCDLQAASKLGSAGPISLIVSHCNLSPSAPTHARGRPAEHYGYSLLIPDFITARIRSVSTSTDWHCAGLGWWGYYCGWPLARNPQRMLTDQAQSRWIAGCVS